MAVTTLRALVKSPDWIESTPDLEIRGLPATAVHITVPQWRGEVLTFPVETRSVNALSGISRQIVIDELAHDVRTFARQRGAHIAFVSDITDRRYNRGPVSGEPVEIHADPFEFRRVSARVAFITVRGRGH